MRKKCSAFNRIYLATLFIFLLLGGVSLYAANTFIEPKGRFAIDLPAGWKLQPQTDEKVYVFKESADSIIMEYFDGALSREELFQKGVATIGFSMPTAAVQGDILDKKINSNPARWGIYRDTLLVGKTKVVLYGLLGSLSLKKGGLYFLVIVNEQTLKAKQKMFEETFQSIRDPEGTLTRTVDEGKAVPASPAPQTAAGEPLKFNKRNVSMVFPAGWVEVDKSGQFEPEFLGFFESRTVPGTTLFIYAYTGFTAGYTNLRIRGLKTIAQMYPRGQEDLKKTKTVKTNKGNSAKVELWRGYLVSGDTVIAKQSPLGILKSEKGGWLMLIGVVPDASGPWFEEEFIKIINTIE